MASTAFFLSRSPASDPPCDDREERDRRGEADRRIFLLLPKLQLSEYGFEIL